MVDGTIRETGTPYRTVRAVLPVLTGDGTAEETAVNRQKRYTGTASSIIACYPRCLNIFTRSPHACPRLPTRGYDTYETAFI